MLYPLICYRHLLHVSLLGWPFWLSLITIISNLPGTQLAGCINNQVVQKTYGLYAACGYNIGLNYSIKIHGITCDNVYIYTKLASQLTSVKLTHACPNQTVD